MVMNAIGKVRKQGSGMGFGISVAARQHDSQRRRVTGFLRGDTHICTYIEVGFGVPLGMPVIPTFALRLPPAKVQGALQGVGPSSSERSLLLARNLGLALTLKGNDKSLQIKDIGETLKSKKCLT